ncbi:ABC transporter ATP-binding protein [Rhodococcus sp. C3V]|uniref:ABC transporter ATP-binding protein n=1 Tax=Rhodococcus sp. C3V TaxID=3034165 RepID=UPI0023E25AD0|nr:ABC transporter ATP-binding protein [Rhodococcus sp. C3V]MDF3319985.1 ABC transporter ATP-binding protein [Rhodococcus sp. C3V]
MTIAPQTVDARINFENVGVDFPDPAGGTKRVLDNINLEIPHGQFIALVGKSGCGKTTLLNMAAALVSPTQGEITVAGTSPRDARSQLGFMLARDALLPWRSAVRNVEYGLELRGVGKAERRERARKWLGLVGLSNAESLWPWQLSQGMRQRVALARTWALNPNVLLMDEPFAALDVFTRVSVQNAFLDLWQSDQRKTVIFVTHDLGEAIALADRIVVLGEGRILDDVEVGLERPRDLESINEHPGFRELHERLRTGLSGNH